jgi:hypothetical protein
VESPDVFRIYVQVESRTVIADENDGGQMYVFSASAGQFITLKVICENASAIIPVQFAYYEPFSLIQRVSDESPITMQYQVPA